MESLGIIGRIIRFELKDKYYEGFNPVMECFPWKEPKTRPPKCGGVGSIFYPSSTNDREGVKRDE